MANRKGRCRAFASRAKRSVAHVAGLEAGNVSGRGDDDPGLIEPVRNEAISTD